MSQRLPPFSTLASSRKNREIEKAVKFVLPMMDINSKGVYAASYLSSVITIFVLIITFLYLNMNPFIALPLTLISSVVIYYIVISYPVSIMNRYRLLLSEESDIIFEQFVLVFQSGGTIFDAIEMVAGSDHPYLSKVFQKMIEDIEQGIPPEECISEFAKNQPSEDLRRYFIGILSSLERKTDLLDMLSGESFEADLALRQKNLELESRLLIVTALTTYIPIILTLALSLGGFATNPVILLLAPFFIAISALTKARFSNQYSAYFDRPQAPGVMAPTQKEIMTEYDEFLNLLMLLGERLRAGDTLEVALAAVREEVGEEIQQVVSTAVDAIYVQEKSLEDAITLATNQALGQRVAHMLRVIYLMCEASASDAGDRVIRIAGRLIQRSAVAKERDSIIAAQRLKVYILVITSSFVLGLMAALAPFLFIGSLLTQGPVWDPSGISLLDIAPLIITLFLTTISNGYQNTQMVSGGRPKVMGLLCGVLFWLSFVIASGLLGYNS